MTEATRDERTEFEAQISGLVRACVVAGIAGVIIGVIGAGFRVGLAWVFERHVEFVEAARAWGWVGWVGPVFVGAVGAAVARLMVRPQPLAAGSGVQHVEAVMRGEASALSLWVVPIKFFGGLVGIGAGLALGREGPTIQMGSTIGAWVARTMRCGLDAIRDLQAALGGAGLAVAFNAPFGGAIFVFEEVAHAFRLRLTVVTLIACITAIAVMRILLGNEPNFSLVPLPTAPMWELPIFVVFGGFVGGLGVLYNRLTIGCIDFMASLKRIPPEARAGLIGAIVGLVAWFAPMFVGGGDELCQQVFNGAFAVGGMVVILVVRWFLGPLSYSAGTPGGLFSPLLLVGALVGMLCAAGWNALVPQSAAISPAMFAVLGMVAFFTGIVRAPLTGVILISEMTVQPHIAASMLATAFGAMLVSSLLRGEPIYDTLRARMLAGFGATRKGRPRDDAEGAGS